MYISWQNLKSEGSIEKFRMIYDENCLGITTKIYAVPRHKLADGTVVRRVPVSFNFQPNENSALPAISSGTMADVKTQLISAIREKFPRPTIVEDEVAA